MLNSKFQIPNSALLVSISLILVLFSVLGSKAEAAEIYFGAPSPEMGLGQKFEANVFLNTENERINAVEGKVMLVKECLAVEEIRDGNSLVSFWIERPEVTTDNQFFKIAFAGIIPGGYNGPQAPLFSILLQTKKQGRCEISASDERLLLNDGLGTEAKIKKNSLTLNISPTLPKEELILPSDTEKPETFIPEVSRDPNLFDNQWFVAFATQDKQSGLDRYEIAETLQEYQPNDPQLKNLTWKQAQSPYQLSDQTRQSFIYLKAMDKAGNERLAIVPPLFPRPWYKKYQLYGIILLAIILILLTAKIIQWKKRR